MSDGRADHPAPEPPDAAGIPPSATLMGPARERLLDLASDVLGRLAAEEVPGPLRPLARFAPAKRRRLGAVALAAVLDADDTFRSRLAEAVQAASPELADAVREGRDARASDPVDVAVVAYLLRPPHWQDVLAAATARWTAERAVSSAPAAELAALREQVAQLRAAGRDHAAALQAAVAAARADADQELATLRRAVRDRTRELRAAERERDAAVQRERDAVEQARADVAPELAAMQDEVRRLEARTVEAERIGENARRTARAERDVDDARLWLLVDSLVQAAGGVRRELALPVPAMRPADLFASAADQDGGSAVGPAALDALLELPHVHVLVDGYNVTKTGYPELPLNEQRTRLTTSLAVLAAQSGAEITVVFDGSVRPPVQPRAPRGVRVLFSAAHEIADDLIRRLVAAEPVGRALVLVTSDRQIVSDTARDGLWAVPSSMFLSRVG